MIDALLHYKDKFRKPEFWDDFNLLIKNYFILTIHRPSNLESKNDLKEMLTLINNNSKGYKVIFPVHPRTSRLVNEINLNLDNLLMINPLSYLEFNYLVDNSLGVITDSGGISEETTVLGIPCITLRDSTERPETVEVGSNILVGSSLHKLKIYMQKIIKGDWKISKSQNFGTEKLD